MNVIAPPRFSLIVRLLHWGGVLLVAVAVVSGLALDEFSEGPLRETVRVVHDSFGVALIALTLMRLLARLAEKLPAWRAGRALAPAPQASPLLERLAGWVQAAMYSLMLLVPSVGLLDRWARGKPVPLFGVPDLPAPFPVPGGKLWGEVHETLAWTLVLLVAAHVAAALWHTFVLRDSTLARMRLRG